MDKLGYLFGGEDKVKILRLFVFNPEIPFDMVEISSRTSIKSSKLKQELLILEKGGIVVRKVFSREVVKKKGKEEYKIQEKIKGWILNPQFEYINDLKSLFSTSNFLVHNKIGEKLSGVGKVKLLIISGIFINDTDSRLDLFIVGDKLKISKIDRAVKVIESQIGKGIRFSAFETPEFQYRFGLYDKLVRDVLDFPHKKLINKLGIE